jgi:hypothetical protein
MSSGVRDMHLGVEAKGPMFISPLRDEMRSLHYGHRDSLPPQNMSGTSASGHPRIAIRLKQPQAGPRSLD